MTYSVEFSDEVCRSLKKKHLIRVLRTANTTMNERFYEQA